MGQRWRRYDDAYSCACVGSGAGDCAVGTCGVGGCGAGDSGALVGGVSSGLCEDASLSGGVGAGGHFVGTEGDKVKRASSIVC